MTVSVTMPALGESVTEGTVTRWLKKEGERVEVDELTVEFPGVRALDSVHFEVRAGEVHALVGENGAGKSTLLKVLGGVHRPSTGALRLSGLDYVPVKPSDAIDAGMPVRKVWLAICEEYEVPAKER